MPETTPQATLDAVLTRSQEVRTPCGDGSLTWRVWGDATSDHPVIVLLHGGFGAWNHWVRTIPALEADFRVFVPDLPGCGDSDDPPEPYNAASLAEIISDGLDTLFAADNTAFDLMGFSFGGTLSGMVAHAQADRIRSLTIVGTPLLGLITTGMANELVAVPRDATPDEAAPIYRSNLEKLMVHNPAAVDDLAMHLHLSNMSKTRLRSRRIARRFSPAESLKDLPCRLNCIFGDSDPTLDPDLEGIRAFVATLQPEARFHVIPETGHWAQYEAAERFNALLPELFTKGT